MTVIGAPFVGDLAEFHITATLGGTADGTTLVAEVAEFGDVAYQKNTIEYSAFGVAYKRKAAGKKNVENFNIVLNYSPGDTDHDALKTLYDGTATAFFTLVWRFGSENTRADFTGLVTSYVITTPEEDVVKVAIDIAISGDVTLDTTTDALL